MKIFLFSFFIAYVASQQCSPSDFPPSAGEMGSFSTAKFWKGVNSEDVYELENKKMHDKFTIGGPPVFVLYYHPGCGYCVDCREGFAGAATEMKGEVWFGAVDCTTRTGAKVCDGIEEVTGYPTFIYYKGGNKWKYDQAGRSQEEFVQWLKAES